MLTIVDKGAGGMHMPIGHPYQSLQCQGLVAMRFVDYAQIYLNPQKVRNCLQPAPKSLLLSNQKKILKRGMT